MTTTASPPREHKMGEASGSRATGDRAYLVDNAFAVFQ